MLKKKQFLTVIGIILSAVIAVGGLLLTDRLITAKSERISDFSFIVTARPEYTAHTAQAADGGVDTETPRAKVTLSNAETLKILRNWSASGVETPHEPTAEQLNMEQAFAVGGEWLAALRGLSLFPEDFFDNITTRAQYLAQNLPQDANGAFLPPAYSYRKLSAANESVNMYMYINAVTGQVWKTEIDIYRADITVFDTVLTDALGLFLDSLRFEPDGGSVITSEDVTAVTHYSGHTAVVTDAGYGGGGHRAYDLISANCFLAGGINATAQVLGAGTDGGINVETLRIYLRVE